MSIDNLDMYNRDPNGVNSHIKVQFEDILGEPAGAHSTECIWRNAYRCFECGKNTCYKLATLCCGLCAALFWGCDFACLAFDHVWLWIPCLRQFTICARCCHSAYGTVVLGCCAPMFETCGLCFSRIRVTKG